MDRIAGLAANERRDLFQESANRRGVHPAIIEKDFWVCWVLDRLFGSDQFSRKLLFKGGTSLSKVFGLIERFSEDIDLILDWNEVAHEDPLKRRSKTKQDRFNKALVERSRKYIKESFLGEVRNVLGSVAAADVQDEAPDVIRIAYPASFAIHYLRPEIRLEIGPLAAWMPNDTYEIVPYAAEEFPSVFKRARTTVRAVKAERTFWEKATILHQEAHRPPDKLQPVRSSRHYYDLDRMTHSEVKTRALEDLELLEEVVQFKRKFYPCAWARYELATPGTMKIVPSDHLLNSLGRDYSQMRIMIFGEAPSFEEIIRTLSALEDEINGR